MTDDQMAKRLREVQLSIPEYMTGTVVSDGTLPLRVSLDSDSSRAEVTPNSNIAGALPAGTRVAMLRQSPSLLVVLGILHTDVSPFTWFTVGDTGVPFQNSWVNYDTIWAAAAYRKIGNAVYLRGLVRSGSVPSVIFTLPVGFRPLKNEAFPAVISTLNVVTGAASAGTAHTHPLAIESVTRLDVTTSGNVQITNPDVFNSYLSLSGVSFFID